MLDGQFIHSEVSENRGRVARDSSVQVTEEQRNIAETLATHSCDLGWL